MTTRPAKYAKSEHDGVLWPSSSGRRPRVGAYALAAARDVGDLFKPIERLGPVSSTHCCASTPGLSTWWSSTALERDLVSRGVSRLDRSEERRGGKEWGSTCRSGWSPSH